MVNIPSTPEIITVNSERLQTTVRDLLPSQNGFGSELQASNVIIPTLDITASAEGSVLRTDLQTALAFGSQTEFSANNSTVVLANSAGFYRIFAQGSCISASSTSSLLSFTMTDGSTTKTIYSIGLRTDADAPSSTTGVLDFIVWLSAGDSISAVTSSVAGFLIGSIRQVADSEGKLVNPSGFPL